MDRDDSKGMNIGFELACEICSNQAVFVLHEDDS